MTTRTSLRFDSKSWSWLEVRAGGLFLRSGEQEFFKPETVRALREKLLLELQKHGDVQEVSNLFDQDETELRLRSAVDEIGGRFLPLVCIFRLTFSRGQQDKSFHFVTVIDGFLILIALLLSREVRTEFFSTTRDRTFDIVSGEGRIFASARDRIMDIARQVFKKVELVPPAMTHESLLVTNLPRPKTPIATPCVKLTSASLKAAMKETYLRLREALTSYYLTAQKSRNAEGIAHQISLRERELLKLVQNFTTTSMHQVFARRSLSKKIRRETTTLLNLLMQYKELQAEIVPSVERLERRFRDDGVATNFVRAFGWKEYVDYGNVDAEAALTVIEHAQSEMESSGLKSVTIWAALVTAIVALAVAIVGAFFHLAP